jgi:uncharacterized protein YlzI (FlbEa/FlbD family)
MIQLTKLNDDAFFINPHQIERIEHRPGSTVVTMQSQNQYIVKEKIEDINESIIKYRSRIGFGSQE